MDNFADGLYRFAIRLTRNETISQDLVQETFTRLWEKHESVGSASARSYLFTTLYHAAIDLLRQKRDTVEVHQIPNTYELPNHDVQEILDRGLALLPDVQRSVILLRDYEGYSYQEISDITQLSSSQVRVYIHRARLFLREFIGNPEELL